ncbi:MAG: diadenylate cyclase, partial [Acidobacteriota bacterium]|nr:diadenylate cyclase [Acidobacteriota bacterium]
FDHHSPGHDGAVILHGDRIQRFAVHLPLSSDQREVGPGGTRHAAGLGLAELTDALCIVVSEERGTVSVARDGHLRILDKPETLASELESFLGSQEPSTTAGMVWARAARRWREALAALATAGLLWGLLVGGSGRGELTCEIPVEVQNLPPGYELEGVEPEQVEVVLGGPRHLLLLGEPEGLHVTLDAVLVQLGRRTYQLNAQQIALPPELEVKSIRPRRVRLSVIPPPGATFGADTDEVAAPAPPSSSEEEEASGGDSAAPAEDSGEADEAVILQSSTVEGLAT